MQPDYDWMLVIKLEKKSVIQLPDGAKVQRDMEPFKIIAIGPGKYEHGAFIKSTHTPGQNVFLAGNVLEAKYEGNTYLFVREREIVSVLK